MHKLFSTKTLNVSQSLTQSVKKWKQIKKISDAAEKQILAFLFFSHNVKHIACQFILRKQLLLLTHKQLSSKQLSMYVWKKVTAASQTIFSMRFVLQTWPWLQWPLLTETSLFAYVCVHYSQVNTFDWKQIKKTSDAAEKQILT